MAPTPNPRTPRGGDLLHLDRAASPQFVAPIRVRVIRLIEWTTFDGWMWLDVYQLTDLGDACARRSLYVRAEGLRYLTNPPARQPARTGPATRTTHPG
ncbi:hypothetical protein [Micromonospora sp. RP3T]|uniref:hypothetical protein n=1 Tax=Micromonospora sp. RP3T TaxID=2135446 RepID=UPI003D7455EC